MPQSPVKVARCGKRILNLRSSAYCRADATIRGQVERPALEAIRHAVGKVELFVKERETPKAASYRRRVFLANALALVEAPAPPPAAQAAAQEARPTAAGA